MRDSGLPGSRSSLRKENENLTTVYENQPVRSTTKTTTTTIAAAAATKATATALE